jgi:hypothetical protein
VIDILANRLVAPFSNLIIHYIIYKINVCVDSKKDYIRIFLTYSFIINIMAIGISQSITSTNKISPLANAHSTA